MTNMTDADILWLIELDLSVGQTSAPNPHYACDTHGAVCPTGEHTLHMPGNPCEGCAKCVERADRARQR